MSKKITLTFYNNNQIDIRIDDIDEVVVQNEVTFILSRGRYAYPVKESKSRVLKMIEAAK